MTSTAILIPARYGSTRYPGKPLAMLDGVPMIKRVYDACTASKIPTYVLTDDMRIFNLFGADKCWIDQTDYANGTERCAGAIKNNFFSEYDQFINVQGDMPDVSSDIIFTVKDLLENGNDVATVYTEMDPILKADPNTVKMIKGTANAQWFGRGFTYGYHHLGIYGYNRKALQLYPILKKFEEEDIEQLEQIRWIKNGWQIGCLSVQYNGVEINSPEDVTTWHNKNSQ